MFKLPGATMIDHLPGYLHNNARNVVEQIAKKLNVSNVEAAAIIARSYGLVLTDDIDSDNHSFRVLNETEFDSLLSESEDI